MKRLLTILMTVLLLCTSVLSAKVVYADDETGDEITLEPIQEVSEEETDLSSEKTQKETLPEEDGLSETGEPAEGENNEPVRSVMEGYAYAILDNGTLLFFRSDETYENGQICDVTINGEDYSGIVYSGIESIDYTLNAEYNEETEETEYHTNIPWFEHAEEITAVDVADGHTIKPITTKYMFYNLTNLSSIDLNGFDTSDVTDMYCMFMYCRSLQTLDLSMLDTSKVEDISCMFLMCRTLRELNLNSFDSLTAMNSTFNCCGRNLDVDLSKFNTSNVTSMNSLFAQSTLSSIDVSGFDTSNVTDMNSMFEASCYYNKSLDLSNFDTSKVTDMAYMFIDCIHLERLDLSSFNTANVERMTSMFVDCPALQEVKLGTGFSKWDDDALLPEGTWKNGSLEKTEAELADQYPNNRTAWAGTWVKENNQQEDPNPEVPEGLKVAETEEGIIFYFDNPGQEEIDYLNDLLFAREYNHYTGEIYEEGSYISIYSTTDSSQYLNAGNKHGSNTENDNTNFIEQIVLSADGTYICIPREVILTNDSLFTSNDVYVVVVHAHDYSDDVYLELNGLQHGKTRFVDGFEVNVTMDNERNIYIRANDENWLEALCKTVHYDEHGEVEKGSYLYFRNTDIGRETVFYNAYYEDSDWSNIQYELMVDESTAEKYIFIRNDLLSQRLEEGTKYAFRFNAYGYPMYYTDENAEGGFIVFSSLKEPASGISVWYGNDGLNIECEDTDFLDALATESVYENDSETTTGGYIVIVCDDGSEYRIRNSRFLNNGEENEYVYYESQYGMIFVECNTLLIHGVTNSESATVVLHAPGYSPVTIEGIELAEVMNSDNPDDVSVSVGENGDLIIDSENKKWLMALCEEYLHAGTPFSPGGSMTFISSDDVGYKICNTEDTNYFYEDGKVIFPAAKQIENHMYSGTYRLIFQPYKYQMLSYDSSIELTGAYYYAPEVTVNVSRYGDIRVSCDDLRWLQMMSDSYESYIQLHNDETSEDFDFNLDEYVLDGNQIILSQETLINRGVYEGTYTVFLYAYGYDGTYQNDVDIVFNEKSNISITQDEETGDLWVTSTDSLWLWEMASLADDDTWHWISFDSGNSFPIGQRRPYVEFVREGDSISGFYITHTALMANNIASGRTSIHFPYTDNYDSITVELDFDLNACKEAPQGLRVEETEEGIRFYFDNLDEEEAEYLNAILCPNVDSYIEGEWLYYTNGSRIEIYDQNWEHQLTAENYSSVYDDGREYFNSEIKLSADGTYVYIPNEKVRNSSLVNSDTISYSITIYAYGYSHSYYDLHLDGLRYANEELDDSFTISVSVDEDGDLIIHSNDQNWVEAACKTRVYGDNGVTIEYGSSFEMVNSETNGTVYFHNQRHYLAQNTDEIQYELKEDDQTGEKYIFVGRDSLLRRLGASCEHTENQRYYFIFSANGFEQYRSDPDTEGEYVQFTEDLIRYVPDLVLFENENGDVIISAEEINDEYLAYLNAIVSNQDNYIEFYRPDKNSGYRFYFDSSISDVPYIEHDQLIIPNEFIINRSLGNGNYEIWFDVLGYDYHRMEITLTKASKEIPDDIELVFNSNADLEICSQDHDWLLALSQGGISMSCGNVNKYISRDRLVLLEDRIVVEANVLRSLGLKDGIYTVYLYANGYENVGKQLGFYGYALEVSSEVYVSGETGDLIITCDDNDFLNALTVPRVSEENEDGYHEISVGGEISLRYPDNTYVYFGNNIHTYYDSTYEDNYISVEGNTAVIPKRNLLEREEIYDSDDITVTLYAYGYVAVEVQPVSIKNVKKDYIPDDVTVTVEENGDITIHSADKEWLKALCQEYDYSTNTGGRLVFVSQEDYSWHSMVNFEYDQIRAMVYSQENSTVTVQSDYLKDGFLSNGDYELRIEPQGYRTYKYGIIAVTGGMVAAPEDVRVIINNDMEMVITSSDENWKETIVENERSYMYITPDSGYGYYAGSNRFILRDGNVIMRKEELQSLSPEDGIYHLSISVFGYEEVSADIELSGYALEPNDEPNISLVNGSLIIECEDTDFLEALVREYKPADEDNPYRQLNGAIYLYDDKQYVVFENRTVLKDDVKKQVIDYVLSDGKVVISADSMLSHGVYNSEAVTVVLNAFGYKRVEFDNFRIDGLINPDLPDDVSVTLDDEGNLYVDSSDKDWLQALCEEYSHEETPSMKGGELTFVSESDVEYVITNTAEANNYVFTDGKVRLSSDKQIENRLYNGKYTVVLKPYKYLPVTKEVTLTGAYRYAPENVTIVYDLDEGIVIRSDDSNWMQVLISDGRSIIKLKNSLGEFVLENSDLVSDNDRILILDAVLKDKGVPEGSYDLYLYAYGYDGVSKKIEIDYPIEFAVAVTQDSITHDLYVTSNDADWISEMAQFHNSGSQNIAFADGSQIEMSDRYLYLEFGATDGFTIRYEALLANHVGSGRQRIIFPTSDSHGQVSVDLDFDLLASKQIPQGLKVEETEEGIRFYFDSLNDEKLAFIKKLIYPVEYDSSQRSIEGSGITIFDESRQYGNLFRNTKRDQETTVDSIVLSQDETYAYIPHEVVLGSSLVNLSSRYDVDLEVYGYVANNQDLYLPGLQFANTRLIDGFMFEASLDEDMNLIIQSNDEGWLEAVCYPHTVKGDATIHAGSYMSLVPIGQGLMVNLFNRYDPDLPEDQQYASEIELRTDASGKKYIFISRETLYDKFEYSGHNDVTGQTYYFTFAPYAYENYCSENGTDNVYVTFAGRLIRNVPDYEVVYRNGDLLITSDDAHWLEMLAQDARSRICAHNNKTSSDTYFTKEHMQLSAEGVVISAQMLKRHGIQNGIFAVRMNAFGYENASKENVYIINPVEAKPLISTKYANVMPVNENIAFSGTCNVSDDLITSWSWNFGDGSAASGKSVTHAFSRAGKYTVEVSVTDLNGNTYTNSKTYTVFDPNDENSEYTLLKLTVVDSNDASPIEGASVFVTDAEDASETYELISGDNGYIDTIVKNGTYNISSIAPDYMARAFTLTANGGTKEMRISLFTSSIMTGEFEVTELSREEAIERGIDVDNPDNNHVYEMTTTLTFRAGLKEYEVDLTYLKNLIELIKLPDIIHIDIPIPDPVPCSEVESCQVIYHHDEPCTGPCPIPSGGGGGGSIKVVVYPISEKFTLVVFGEAHWMKEMFQVALVVNNDSVTDTLEQTTAVLELPNGMSLAEMVEEMQSSVSVLNTIDPKDSATAIWFLRGDSEGDYNIRAHVTAIDMPYGTTIEEDFETKEPIHVYAGSALKLTISVKDVIERGKDFTVKYRLENVSDRSVYDFTFGLLGSQEYKVVRYSDKHEESTEITGAEFGETWTRHVDELAPGGYIELELSATIWFKSFMENAKFIPIVGSYIDIAYYLDNLSIVSLGESTTTIPYEFVVEREQRDYLVDWLIDSIADELLDLPDFTLGGTIIEVVGASIGLPVSMIKFAKTWLKLQQGETDYVMSISIDDGLGTENSIENDVVRMTAGDAGNAVVDVLNGNKFKLTAREIKIESKLPGTSRLKFSIEDTYGNLQREFIFDIVVEDNEVKDVIKINPDGISDEFSIDENEMKASAERVKEDTKEVLQENPFLWIDSTISFDLDEKTSSANDGYTLRVFNDDHSGGGVLWTKTHNHIEINGTTASLDFTREAWKKIADESDEEFTIIAKRLTDDEAAQFGVDGPVYQFKAETSGNSISNLEGSVYVTVPYELTDPNDADSIYVEHFKDDGTSEILPGIFDSASNTVRFETTSFSYFAICEGEPDADTLTLDQETMSLFVGEQKKLSVLEGTAVSWSSDNEEVATVDENGTVAALSKGSAVITARSLRHPELSASCQVTVNEPVDPYGDILPEDRPSDPSLIPAGFWTSEMIYDAEDPLREIRYTGSPITLSFRVYDYNRLLHEGTDYTVKYTSNTKAGTASVTVTGKGNYTGSLVKNFEILPARFNDEDTMVILDRDVFIENGKAQKPTVKVVHDGVQLKNKTDYVLSYDLEGKTTEPGDYSLTISGNGNYEGAITRTYTIYDKGSFVPVSALKVTGIKNFAYTGEEIEQEDIRVYYGKDELVQDVDYTVSYSDNIDTGTAYVIIEGTMNMDTEEGQYSYAGTLTKSFKITQLALSSKTTEVYGLEEGKTEFTGEAITWDLLVVHNDRVLDEDIDYTLTYKNNVKAGTAAVTIKGIGNYKGSLSKTFKIEKVEIKDSDVDLSDTCEYTKGGTKPQPKIVVNGRELVSGTDYTLTYKNNTKMGTASVTIKGKGSYLGTVTRQFEIIEREISDVTMTVADKVTSSKANGWKSTPVLTDSNGKKLAAGTDYSKTMSYTYYEDTLVLDGSLKERPEVLRRAGDEVLKNDILPVNAVIEVTVNTEGLKTNNFVGEISQTYRIVAGDISKATVKVTAQYYTGDPVEPSEDEISVKLGKNYLSSEDFEIESYENNIDKGTAYVTIRGIGMYGGTKRVKFTINQKTMAQTIHFNPNGATSGTMKDMKISKDTALIKNAFKKTGYTFKGWSESPDGPAEYADKQIFRYDSGRAGTVTVLYAIWEENS